MVNRDKENKAFFKQAATSDNGKGVSPLVITLSGCPEFDTVETFIAYAPKTLRIQDADGLFSPLHIAVRFGNSLKIASAIVQAYPESVKVKNILGLLPFHYIFTQDTVVSVEVVIFLF